LERDTLLVGLHAEVLEDGVDQARVARAFAEAVVLL
jgi:hypothetical protein